MYREVGIPLAWRLLPPTPPASRGTTSGSRQVCRPVAEPDEELATTGGETELLRSQGCAADRRKRRTIEDSATLGASASQSPWPGSGSVGRVVCAIPEVARTARPPVGHLADRKDPRVHRTKKHRLDDTLVIALVRPRVRGHHRRGHRGVRRVPRGRVQNLPPPASRHPQPRHRVPRLLRPFCRTSAPARSWRSGSTKAWRAGLRSARTPPSGRNGGGCSSRR